MQHFHKIIRQGDQVVEITNKKTNDAVNNILRESKHKIHDQGFLIVINVAESPVILSCTWYI